MNFLLNIVLLLFCIGVTYSAGVNSNSDGALNTVKPPTMAPVVQPDQIKIQMSSPSNNSSTLHSVTPAPSTVASSSVKDEPVTAESKSKPPSIVDNKNATASAKNTSAVTVAIPRQENTTLKNNTVPAETKTSTEKSTIITTTATLASTVAPVVSISDHSVPTSITQERQFDGPSFVGGIVLTVGLTVIGFIAFKFYKSGKIERNYRTF